MMPMENVNISTFQCATIKYVPHFQKKMKYNYQTEVVQSILFLLVSSRMNIIRSIEKLESKSKNGSLSDSIDVLKNTVDRIAKAENELKINVTDNE